MKVTMLPCEKLKEEKIVFFKTFFKTMGFEILFYLLFFILFHFRMKVCLLIGLSELPKILNTNKQKQKSIFWVRFFVRDVPRNPKRLCVFFF